MRWRDERGTILLEGMIVYGITLILLFFMLAIFSILYQRWNIQTIANESAARVAQTFKYKTADVVSGKVSLSDLVNMDPYRYGTFVTSYDSWEGEARAKLIPYATDRLARTTYTQDVDEPSIEIDFEQDGLARRHIVVTITGSYKVPFGETLDFLGFPGTTSYRVSAYAECVDISDYLVTVGFVGRVTSLKFLDSDLLDVIDSAIQLGDTILKPNKR